MKQSLLTVTLCVTALLALASCSGPFGDVEHEEVLHLRHKGADMPIWVRGNIESDVVLLIVHGGAGGNSGVYVDTFMEGIENDYAVAYWDQRHGGSSQGRLSRDDFNHENALDLMAEDMKLVIELLRARYGQDTEVFAMGHSWGVQLGTKFLIEHDPELLDGWIASNGMHSAYKEYEGRVEYLNTYLPEMISGGESFSSPIRAGDVELSTPQQALEWVEANPAVETWEQSDIQWQLAGEVAKYVLDKYTELDPPSAHLSPFARIFSGPGSPFAETRNLIRTGTLINNANNETSIQEFYDMSSEMGKITIPVALLWGEYDNIAPPLVARDYHTHLGTPEEDITVSFYPAGHSPMIEQHADFIADLRAFIEAHRDGRP